MTELNEQRLRRSLEQAADEVTGAGDPSATWQRASYRVTQRRRRRRVASAAAAVLVVGVAAAATLTQVLDSSVPGEPDVAEVDEGADDADEAEDGSEAEGAGEAEGKSEPSGTDTDEAAPESLATEPCVNEEAGFALNYPDDWHAREGRCSAFGTEPLGDREAIGGGMLPGVHILAKVRDTEFDRYVRRAESSDTTVEVLDREERRVDGRRALRRERVVSGGAYPEPTRVTSWVIELDADRVLTLHTTDARGSEQYRRDVEVLDAIAESARPLDEE